MCVDNGPVAFSCTEIDVLNRFESCRAHHIKAAVTSRVRRPFLMHVWGYVSETRPVQDVDDGLPVVPRTTSSARVLMITCGCCGCWILSSRV